jgi:lysine-specific demethylase/histidyl-hydroxylase NO66
LSADDERGSGVPRPALSRLISVGPTAFADEYWGVKPLLSPSGADGFDDLFSLRAADELIAHRGIRTPFVRMANEGSLLDASRYTSPGGFGAEVGDQLDPAKVLAEFAAGSTVVLQGLHRTWAPLADFTRELAAELSAPSQVNAYITPASSRGFDPHYDVHDVFVIQIHGEKRWTIHPPVHEHPLRDQPWSDHSEAVAARATEPPAIEATFRPGDVLYLPRGWIHSAVATGGTSIHLTIGVAAFTGWDIVEQLVEAAKNDPALRSPMPLGVDFADAASLAPLVAATSAALAARLAHPDAPPVGTRLASRLASSSRPEPVLPLATVETLSTLDPATTVSWRRGLARRIEREGDRVVVVLAGRRISLPAEAAAAIEALAAGDAEAGALAGLDESSSLVVASRLLREGVLVVR